jgi:WD40 repeat protein/tRNA A-37 threonylcarbamoyl transferase component Bud32
MAGDASSNSGLSIESVRRIDELCDRFESELKAGRRLDPVSWLPEVDEAARGELVRNLLALELEYTDSDSQARVIAAWRLRFPGYREAIESLVKDRKEKTRTLPPPSPAGSPTIIIPNAAGENTAVFEETQTARGAEALDDGDTYRLAAAPLQRFGDYELLQEIARGGMGVVYKARQLTLHRIVALKMILAGQLASKMEVERFYSEARAAGELQHPNIVAIHEVGQHNGQHFFSMDYVDGPSLADKVVNGTWPPREAARLMRQIAKAVHYAHTRGIVHRDLKPRNVLLTAEGQPRITDFGLAKRLHGTSDLTASGQIMGTPSFMSPEQAQGKVRGVGPPSDVYSLGAILYCLLTGRPPFSGRDAIAVLTRVITQDPTPPKQLNPELDKDLETITLKCLRKDPQLRYSSAKELADDLNRFLKGEPIQARPVRRSEKLWRWCRRKPLLASLIAAVGLLVVLLLVTASVAWALWPRVLARRLPEQAIYADHIRDAQRALDRNNVAAANRSLDACRPELRGWEFHYLAGMTKKLSPNVVGEQQTLSLETARLPAGDDPSRKKPIAPVHPVTSVAFSPDGERIAGANSAGILKVWDARSGQERMELRDLASAAFSPDGKRIAGVAGGKPTVWDLATERQAVQLEWPTRIMAERPNAVWDAENQDWVMPPFVPPPSPFQPAPFRNAPFRAAPAHSTPVQPPDAFRSGNWNCIGYSPDGKRIAMGSWDKSIKVWDAGSGKQTLTLMWHGDAVQCIAFSPDSKRIVSGSSDRTLKLWDVASDARGLALDPGSAIRSVRGRERLTLRGHEGAVCAVSFSPDGGRIVSASADGTLKVWDAGTGHETLTIEGHLDQISSVAFSPDGSRIASGSADGELRLWDTETGRGMLALTTDAGGIRAVAFSRDGTRIVSGSSNGTIRIWGASNSGE